MKKIVKIALFLFVPTLLKSAALTPNTNMLLNENEQIVKDTLFQSGYTPEAAAAVMGVVGGESAFKALKEASYRNTDNNRIRAIFPVRLGSYTDPQLNTLKQSDENFFNAVYGGMFGNAANEGFKYVGRGFNGITFKANYQAAAAGTGIDFVNNPALLEQPRNAAKALAWYFRSIKNTDNLERAFQQAYVLNAGIGRTFQFYESSQNPVHKTGIPLKRSKAQMYYNGIGGRAALFFFVHISGNSGNLFSSKIENKTQVAELIEKINELSNKLFNI